jgi:uncharacterized protein (DUF1778 family)
MTKSEHIHIRATRTDKRRWTAAAKARGMTLSEYLTACANKGADDGQSKRGNNG